VAGPTTKAMSAAEHTADRPSWDCRSCGTAWPCHQARKGLIIELDRVSLAIFMWVNLEEAAFDLPAEPPSGLFERFIGWTR
jgi:hypothetical protein